MDVAKLLNMLVAGEDVEVLVTGLPEWALGRQL
jgi:hypothetical protein